MKLQTSEIWDLYDAHGHKTGMTAERGAPIPAGYYHPVVHVCLFNEQGQMLIQKRNPDKALEPGKWDLSAGGAGIAGEQIYQAAERELYEELGIRMDLSGVTPHVVTFFDSGFDSYYLINVKEAELSPRINTGELQAIRFASEGEIIGMLKEGTFVAFKESFLSLLFSMRTVRGSLAYPT